MANDIEKFELIVGGENSESNRGYGDVKDLIHNLHVNLNFEPIKLFEEYAIDGGLVDTITERVSTAKFKAVTGDSLSTDLTVQVPNDLRDQMAVSRNQDVVKVHANLIDSFLDVLDVNKDTTIQTVYAWEIGRYFGRLLHDEVILRQRPIGLPQKKQFSEKFYGKIFSDLDITVPLDITGELESDHFRHALPERIASTVGGGILIMSGIITSTEFDKMVDHFRSRIVRDYTAARDFGVNDSNGISIAEFGATHPIDFEDLRWYCQYVRDTDSVSFLRTN